MENEKIKDILKNSMGYFAVALVSAVYMVAALIKMEETGKTVAQIVADGALNFVMGLIINRMLEVQGILNGESLPSVKATYAEHGRMVVRISPYIERLDGWCELKTAQTLKFMRRKVLAAQGMKYELYFDEDGRALDFLELEPMPTAKMAKKRWKARLRCYNKALRVKITPLSASRLTSDAGKSSDPFFFSRTKSQYEKQSSAADVVLKIVTALFFGYYGVELILNFTKAELIYRALQIAMFIGIGIIKMYQAQMFITDEYRGGIVKKIDYLQMFENTVMKEKPTETEEKENGDNGKSDAEPVSC